jgi:hypothetical protein
LDEGQVRASLVTGNYFSVLGVGAAVGRTFSEDDDKVEGAHPVTVISYDYWEQKFGRAADIVGRTLTLNGTTYTIIGVTPRGFAGEWVGRLTDLWFPVAMAYQLMPEFSPGPRGSRPSYLLIARLKPGVTPSQVQAAGQLVYQQFLREQVGQIRRLSGCRRSRKRASKSKRRPQVIRRNASLSRSRSRS